MIKLLLDANLSWRLCRTLKQHFDDCLHVNQMGLPSPVKDNEIWDFARKADYLIVTNDEDFLDLIALKGFPPNVILLRTGNQTNSFVEALLIKHAGSIAMLASSNDYGLLELY